jgi:hypothetical protein
MYTELAEVSGSVEAATRITDRVGPKELIPRHPCVHVARIASIVQWHYSDHQQAKREQNVASVPMFCAPS